MPKVGADEVRTYEHGRFYRQPGGPGPQNGIYFSGVDTQHMWIGGVTIPIRGSVTPIRARNPTGRGFKTVGIARAAPDFSSATLNLLEGHGAIPWQHGDLSCPFNLYEAQGKCGDLADFTRGWETMRIYSLVEASQRSDGDRGSWDSDSALITTLDMVVPNGVYTIGGIALGEVAAATVTRPIISLVYGDTVQCGDCGVPSDGTKILYGLQQTDLSAVAANVVYSTNRGGTWSTVAITGVGATEPVVQIGVMGQYLVVLGQDCLYHATINPYTGIPGTFTKVTTGFSGAVDCTAMYIASPREAWICATLGYIYRCHNVPQGVEVIQAGGVTTNNYQGIHGHETTIVAVGASETVVISTNNGASWGRSAADPAVGVGVNYTDVAVIDADKYWITGPTVSYTIDHGHSWNEVALSSTLVQANQVLFITEDVGYILVNESGGGGLWATWDGGRNWVKTTQQGGGRWISAPSVLPHAVLAAPIKSDVNVAVNNLCVAGASAAGSDGLILLGAATFK